MPSNATQWIALICIIIFSASFHLRLIEKYSEYYSDKSQISLNGTSFDQSLNICQDHRKYILEKSAGLSPSDLSSKLPQIIEEGFARYLKPKLELARIRLVEFSNRDEIKYVLTDEVGYKNDKCNLVTLGIGKDITAEQRFLKAFPGCKLYGADPVENSGSMYNQIGAYFPVGVAAEATYGSVKVLNNSRYENINITSFSLHTFITDYVKQKYIDHVWMDVEGKEFDLVTVINQVTQTDGAYVICQLNVEFHELNGGGDRVDQLMHFLTNSTFIPLKATTGPFFGLRLFAVNVVSQYCKRKYDNLCDYRSGNKIF